MPAHQTVTPIIIVQMHPNVRRDLARLHQLDHEHGGAAFPMYYLYSLQAAAPRQRLEIVRRLPYWRFLPLEAAHFLRDGRGKSHSAVQRILRSHDQRIRLSWSHHQLVQRMTD